jgi:hypothetical protein
MKDRDFIASTASLLDEMARGGKLGLVAATFFITRRW